LTGPPGPKGDTGVSGSKGGGAGGVVYVCWGPSSCPDTGAELVYTGRAAGSDHLHKGSGGNPQSLPLDNQYTILIYRTNSIFTSSGAHVLWGYA